MEELNTAAPGGMQATRLRDSGTPSGANDLWIACNARRTRGPHHRHRPRLLQPAAGIRRV